MTELLNQKQDTEAVNNKLMDIRIEGFCFGMNGLDIKAKQYIQNSLKYLTEIDSILPSEDNTKNKLTFHILDTLVQKVLYYYFLHPFIFSLPIFSFTLFSYFLILYRVLYSM